MDRKLVRQSGLFHVKQLAGCPRVRIRTVHYGPCLFYVKQAQTSSSSRIRAVGRRRYVFHVKQGLDFRALLPQAGWSSAGVVVRFELAD
jgi:hypothetical protein